MTPRRKKYGNIAGGFKLVGRQTNDGVGKELTMCLGVSPNWPTQCQWNMANVTCQVVAGVKEF